MHSALGQKRQLDAKPRKCRDECKCEERLIKISKQRQIVRQQFEDAEGRVHEIKRTDACDCNHEQRGRNASRLHRRRRARRRQRGRHTHARHRTMVR